MSLTVNEGFPYSLLDENTPLVSLEISPITPKETSLLLKFLSTSQIPNDLCRIPDNHLIISTGIRANLLIIFIIPSILPLLVPFISPLPPLHRLRPQTPNLVKFWGSSRQVNPCPAHIFPFSLFFPFCPPHLSQFSLRPPLRCSIGL